MDILAQVEVLNGEQDFLQQKSNLKSCGQVDDLRNSFNHAWKKNDEIVHNVS